uniref:Phytanoyl-CoA dioxygenase n=1 Tax=Heterorhabditis bacteriophora TaxID=37862 RepID=A0A1I7XDS4_HETBA
MAFMKENDIYSLTQKIIQLTQRVKTSTTRGYTMYCEVFCPRDDARLLRPFFGHIISGELLGIDKKQLKLLSSSRGTYIRHHKDDW